MRVVVVGGDARAHVLAHVLSRSADDVVVSGGNAGTPNAVASPPEELDGDLFVISPEKPLVAGLADRLRAQGKRVYGPGVDGARLEGSKGWMKQLVAKAGVPTAQHATFSDAALALDFLRTMKPPFVVKTDGLADGKGVLVTESLIEAEDDVKAKLAGASFGEAGRTVVIEEGMAGPELSVLAVCDGHRAVLLSPAQDFKRAYEGDNGPNTGGMGAYSPVPIAGDDLLGVVMDRFVEPTLAALRAEGIDYRGTLYGGLMLTPDGLKLVEYNVRFGDPEAQVVLPRLSSDLVDLLATAADGALSDHEPTFISDAAVCVVGATPGYPESPRTGAVIDSLDAIDDVPGTVVFCAGVDRDSEGRLVTAGGRVLSIVGFGPTIATARDRAYEGVRRVGFAGMQYRNDIAAAAAKEETDT
ncbi:MAG: phosphoribosylamine---glycine ligase [Acidimicrobiaceae bacterium]|jgi:phosphoribosylamine--glycine ligase